MPVYRKSKDGSFIVCRNDPGPKFRLMTDPDGVPPDLQEHVLSDLRTREQAGEILAELAWKGNAYEYHLVNIGAYNTEDRLRDSLDHLGKSGWKLVHALDKSSNWMGGKEKVFLIFMRDVAS
jgi:hypothetical protein